MPSNNKVVVLVHGWSVYNTSTYGELADRLRKEADDRRIPQIDIVEIWLGKYVSFADEVRVADLALGFENALRDKLGNKIDEEVQIICITHSTGGPVVREWWNKFYVHKEKACPMSHLIMLAPANFGSALAQLGKSRLSRIKSWFEGVEPGQGVLDWLEMGSSKTWELNHDWIADPKNLASERSKVFQFVLTGQSIDRALYDHVNAYSGELGSDGVVRVAAANLNATYVKLIQSPPTPNNDEEFTELNLTAHDTSPRTAFSIIRGRSHSGEDIGILRSIKNDGEIHPTIEAIVKCLNVETPENYEDLTDEFEKDNELVLEEERIEKVEKIFAQDRYFIHDRNSMIIFRLIDDKGFPVEDFDLKFTGENDSPNGLPPGFFVDKQRNKLTCSTLTYFFNYDVMTGCPSAEDGNKEIREECLPLKELGLAIKARPDEGFVHYIEAHLKSAVDNVKDFLKPNQTIMVDIELKRVVHTGVFDLTKNEPPEDFRDQDKGEPIVE
jgi:hypothetical protein